MAGKLSTSAKRGRNSMTFLYLALAIVLFLVPIPVIQGALSQCPSHGAIPKDRALKAKPQANENITAPLVPGFFIFGDSSVDCGNNNYLLGFLERADIPPYGQDFDTHQPTGRFCNGRLAIDTLALHLGLPFVPPFLGMAGVVSNMLEGVNFASASAEILSENSSNVGQQIPLTQQIQQASGVFQSMSDFLGPSDIEIRSRISESLFYISIGINDYIHVYLRNISGIRSIHSPQKFSKLLVGVVRNATLRLYNMNARKIVFVGMGPLGCAPRVLFEANSPNGKCIEEVNSMIIEYNYALRQTVMELGNKLSDAKFLFCDMYYATMNIIENPWRYGFKNVQDACCGLGKYGGWFRCSFPGMACPDPSPYVWWDQYHPTSAVNEIMAANIWSSEYMSSCTPSNLKGLLSSET